MIKISGFQENFVNKLPYTNVKLSRTQQRQLDYKQLYEYESTDIENGSDLVCYDWKIQNETILSQYTSIRLRFSSKQTTSKRQNKQHVENHMGVLGFIDRYRNNASGNTPTRNSDTSFDDVNAMYGHKSLVACLHITLMPPPYKKTQVQLPTRYLILKIKIFMKTEQLI